MKAKRLTSISACKEEIRCLYESAFPEEEQIPYEDLLQLVDRMNLDFTAYYKGTEFVGFTIVYPRDTFNWFWYFAVKEDLRGNGCGQQILSMLIEKYKGCSNILDMESPEQECRQGFLLHNFQEESVKQTVLSLFLQMLRCAQHDS